MGSTLLLLLAAPASAHELHGSVYAGADAVSVPHVTLLALAVAGGLLLGPSLTRREGSPVRRLRALQVLAVASLVGAVAADLTPTTLALAVLLTAALALPGTSPAAKGAFLLVAPSLFLRPFELETHTIVTVGHVLGAGLWAGTVVHLLTLTRLDRSAWRAGTRPAVAGIAVSSLSGVLSASELGLTPGNVTDSGYGTAVLVKASVVLALVVGVAVLSRRTQRERVLRTESFVLLGVLATGVVLSIAPPPGLGLELPPGLTVAQGRSLLLTADGDRRVLRVAPVGTVTVDGQAVPSSIGLDGAVAVDLPARGTVEVDGRAVALPERAVPLSAGPGDDGERLARTLGRVASGRAEQPVADPTDALVGQEEDLRARRLTRPVVVTDGDPRGLVVAQALGADTVDVEADALPAGADIAYVATSWAGARAALALVDGTKPVGGAVLLPWLVAPVTMDIARAEPVTALSDLDLLSQQVFGYRRMLSQLPAERPTLVGLAAWDAAAPQAAAFAYAATPTDIFPAELAHAHDGGGGLPSWTEAGSIVNTRRHVVSG